MGWGTPAHAAIASPDTQTVNTIEAYRNVIETGDQLYLVTFNLQYASSPAQDSNALFLFRLMDGVTEIAVKAPFSFFNNGYSEDSAVVSFYFTASDPNLPAWQTANLSVQFIGNPAFTWASGSPPFVNNNVVDSFNDGNTLIPARVRVLATNLEAVYSLDMIELLSGVLKLTDQGALYFETVIENLRIIAPDLFSDIVSNPEFTEREFTNTQQGITEARWAGDPILGLDDAATELNISRMWVSSIVWLFFSFGIVGVLVFRFKIVRPGIFLFGALMIIGSFTGLIVFEAGIFAAVFATLAVVFTLFWRGSP